MRFFQGGMDGLEGLGTGFYLSSFFLALTGLMHCIMIHLVGSPFGMACQTMRLTSLQDSTLADCRLQAVGI